MSYDNPPVGTALPAAATTASLPLPGSDIVKSPVQTRRLSQRTQSLMGVQILSCGAYVPDVVVTNDELATRFGFDANWIVQRSGIESRRYARPEQATSDLCVEAARKVIRNARVNPSDIDLLVVGTFTPDYTIPSAACLIQERLDLDCPAVDLQAACSGFMYAVITASQYVLTGNSQLALVIGGDCNSRVINPHDQRTAPLFGDGAGAVLLAKGSSDQGFICYQLGADGSGGPLLDRVCGGSKRPLTAADIDQGLQYMHMEGKAVFKWAVNTVTETIRLVLEKASLTVNDVGLFILHQANLRIINAAADSLGIPREKLVINLQKYGNTSAGSIPIALEEAMEQNRVQRGTTILMSGFGAGLTWGTALYRW